MDERHAIAKLKHLYHLLDEMEDVILHFSYLVQESPLDSGQEDAIINNLRAQFDTIKSSMLPVRDSFISLLHDLTTGL